MTELTQILEKVGFAQVRLTATFDCFRGTSKEETAREFGVHGANIFARRLPAP